MPPSSCIHFKNLDIHTKISKENVSPSICSKVRKSREGVEKEYIEKKKKKKSKINKNPYWSLSQRRSRDSMYVYCHFWDINALPDNGTTSRLRKFAFKNRLRPPLLSSACSFFPSPFLFRWVTHRHPAHVPHFLFSRSSLSIWMGKLKSKRGLEDGEQWCAMLGSE